MPTLVIVESPTKARTIRNYLPKDYQVEASMGHVRDLPQSAGDIPSSIKGKKWGFVYVSYLVTSALRPMGLHLVSNDIVRELHTLSVLYYKLLVCTH